LENRGVHILEAWITEILLYQFHNFKSHLILKDKYSRYLVIDCKQTYNLVIVTTKSYSEVLTK